MPLGHGGRIIQAERALLHEHSGARLGPRPEEGAEGWPLRSLIGPSAVRRQKTNSRILVPPTVFEVASCTGEATRGVMLLRQNEQMTSA